MDTLVGGNGNDTLYGGEGSDYLSGGDDDDVLDGGDNNDQLEGDGGEDTLRGGAGDDKLNGGFGDDIFDGGTGNDGLVDFDGNDTYLFGRGSGYDYIRDLGGNDKILLGSGVLPADVTLFHDHYQLFVVLDQSPTQLYVINQFGAPNFKIENIQFSDGLVWDAAAIASRTVSGTPDAMPGSPGDDTYFVDDRRDTIAEGVNQGVDTVQSSVSYSLHTTEIENLTLTGYVNLNGWGSGLDNVIIGNSGINQLDGGPGRDTITGGAGAER